jgi:hypothetical protein
MGKKAKSNIAINFKTVLVPVGKLKPNVYNPNSMTPFLMESLKQGITNDGFIGAIWAVKKTNVIIDGEHRWQAASELGMPEVPVIYLDVDDETAKKLTIATIEKHGERDKDKMQALLQELVGDDTDLAVMSLDIGIEEKELNKLLETVQKDLDDNQDQVDKIDKGGKQSGDVEYDTDGNVVVAPGVDPKIQHPVVFYAPNKETHSKLTALFKGKHSDDLQIDKLLSVVEFYLDKHPDEKADVEASMATINDDFDFGDDDDFEDDDVKPAKKGSVKVKSKAVLAKA